MGRYEQCEYAWVHLERWLSGLRQRFTKPPFPHGNRGFESHSLRKHELARGSL